MLEWLEVRLDVRDNKRLMYKCRIETLNSDGDALRQECCLARIADSGTQSPTNLTIIIITTCTCLSSCVFCHWYVVTAAKLQVGLFFVLEYKGVVYTESTTHC